MEDWYSGIYLEKKLKDNRVVSWKSFYNRDGLNVIFGSVLRKGFQSTTDPMLQVRNPDLKKIHMYLVQDQFQLKIPLQ